MGKVVYKKNQLDYTIIKNNISSLLYVQFNRHINNDNKKIILQALSTVTFEVIRIISSMCF